MLVNFEVMKGEILKSITGLEKKGDQVIFECESGKKYKMYHSQDCCESVYIDDVVGDISDLIGHPLLVCEEVSNEKLEDDFKNSFNYDPESVYRKDVSGRFEPESCTWTFYKLATIKGSVDIRWYGESNGYYSESVDFKKIT